MNGTVVKNKEIYTGHFLLSVKLPDSFKTPMPGQFVMLREAGRIDPLLGRPFGVYHFERSGNGAGVVILYKVVGKGTVLLSRLKEGDFVELFGPYGRAFDIYPEAGKVAFICGGIGVAPITYLALHYRRQTVARDVKLVCYYGASKAGNLVGMEKLEEICGKVFISTDDGSAGYQGMITEKFAEDVSSYESGTSRIYACGPRPMLKQLRELLAENPVSCQILMEERMACGVGACLGCTVPLNDVEGIEGYARACIDGPVFNIRDIRWI
ncbi:MAG TPA: dihydroorotate dehydrogenase electron transfer subunit [Syntrophales bacterium]|nr:dihydroorotate dehydrogenase electron transfer subunit [Syntrophales bacterium]